MDPNTIATIAAFLVLTFADQGMTALWAWRLGPNRARDMILSDPLFKELRASLDGVNGRLDAYKDELKVVEHDIASLRSYMDNALTTASRDTRTSIREDVRGIHGDISALALEIKGIQLSKADIVVPEAEIRRVTQSVNASVRMMMKDGALLESIEDLLDKKLETLPGAGDDDLEALLQDKELNTTEGKQAAYEWLMKKDVPEGLAFRIADQGGATLRMVAKKRGWNLLELTGELDGN